MSRPTPFEPSASDIDTPSDPARRLDRIDEAWTELRAATFGALTTMPSPAPRPSIRRMVHRALPSTV